MQVVLNKLHIFFLSNYIKGHINSKIVINIYTQIKLLMENSFVHHSSVLCAWATFQNQPTLSWVSLLLS